MKIGAQLYTCAAYCKNLEDLSETLKKVKDIGYTTVQLSGICKYEPEWMNEQLDKNGLTAPITHYDTNAVADKTDEVIEFHKKMNIKYIGIGGLRGLWDPPYYEGDNRFDYWERFARDFVPAAKKIKDAGCYFMYHNHHYEFMMHKGRVLYEFLLNHFPSDIMGFTADVYWFQAAKLDPAEMLDYLKGRTPVVHYKDMVVMPDGAERYAPIGSGILDWDKIIEVSLKNNVEYAMVEQDNCYDEDPFVCLKKSYDFLASKGLN